MARKTVVTLVDDIDGSEAVETVEFSIDGTAYEIDLSADNATALREAFKPYLNAGRKTAGRAVRRGNTAGTSSRVVREWATENGIAVPTRGRIPASVQEQYRAAYL